MGVRVRVGARARARVMVSVRGVRVRVRVGEVGGEARRVRAYVTEQAALAERVAG
jgi:hypothetical protein